jgi:TonB family protein
MKTPAASMPPPAVTALPFDTAKMKAGAAQAAPPPAKEPPAPRSRTAFYIGFGVVATVVFAGIMVVLDARKERADALYKEQVAELDHHKTEQLLEQEQVKEKEEADAAQRELATAIEITRKQTEDETRRKVLAELEAERLSKLPGTIAVATTPPGASVSIDGAAPLLSPVKLDGVPPGVHSVKITLAGHDSASLTARVVGSQTADLGTVALASVVGALEVSSNPDALEFYVRPASDPTGKPVRSGRAPASFADIPFGDYVVTFTRPGCRDHVEKVTVRRDGTSQVTTTYVDGSLELASDPSGAWVDKDGIRLGTTPLTLTGLTPKTSVFDLTLPGYDPTPVTCEIPEGDTARVSAQLLRKDRIFNPNEVKTPPQSYESPKPELSDSQRKMGAEVLLSLIVDRDGDVRDVEVVKATDDDIARRCQAAVEKWKFRPATAPDDRAVEARIEVPFKFPAESS